MPEAIARDLAEVRRLLAAIDAYSAEIARQRTRLRTTWQTMSQDVDRAEGALRAMHETLNSFQTGFDELMREFGVQPAEKAIRAHASKSQGLTAEQLLQRYLQANKDGRWLFRSDIAAAFYSDLTSARQRFIASRAKKTFGDADRRMGAEILALCWVRLSRLWELRRWLEGVLTPAVAARSRATATAQSAADLAVGPAQALAAVARDRLPAPLQPWDSPAWADWNSRPPVPGLDQVYVGDLVPLDDAALGDNASFGSTARIPLFLAPRRNLEFTYDAASREQALSLARTVLIRKLTAVPPGDLRFCFFDPVGLGQSVADFLGLGEYDAGLIGGKVWSSQADLTARLTELTSHIELVIQKYLRTVYKTIDEFNAAAGEIAEPYRYLVVADFPTAFNEETVTRLKSIMQNGPRCGVYTLSLSSRAVTPGYGVDPGQVAGEAHRISVGANFAREHDGYTLQMRLVPGPGSMGESVMAASIIESVGRRVASRTEAAVTFGKAFTLFAQVARRGLRTDLPPAAASTDAADERTWWQADSTRGLFAPIGQKGARDAAILPFDSGDHSGALLVGRPGSGKSTLLHTLIGGLTTLYSPRELELYLIDFKEGVEFKAYAEGGLPHARIVAIESDREFGLSVLQSLEAEISRRGELLRATGGRHAGLQALREATGGALPRVLLVFDEFQVLFARNDKVGLTAAGLLETIIRQGRGFGIHVMLGSQSLAGLDALGAHVPQLLPVRILLPATEADARRVLGEGNDAGQYLTTHGEGILNVAGGAVEANEKFKGALLAEPDRVKRVRRLRARADAAGFTRRPTVFEGNASVPLDTISPTAFRAGLVRTGTSRDSVRLRAGVPMTTGGDADIDLRREAGANVLAVVRGAEAADAQPGGGPAYGLLTACVAAAAQSPARIDVIDFMPADDGLDELFEPLLEGGQITLRRRRAFAPLIEELRKEVRGRVEDDDLLRQARIAFLFGIHRARELDSDLGSLDADPELAEALDEVMRDGPEAGIHVWIWSDSVGGAARRLSSRMMRECTWRIAGKMSSDDSLSLLGDERAAEIRDRQLVVSNDDRGMVTRVLSFGLPRPGWLAHVSRGAAPVPPVGEGKPYA